MQELIHYIAQFDPGYPATARGAAPEEIDQLERLAGRPLPPNYRDFLRTLGRSTGTFEPFPDGVRTDIDELLDLYGSERPEYPERFLLIGTDYGGYRMDLFLEVLSPLVPHRVVRFDRHAKPVTPEIMSLEAESLEELLYGMAFFSVRMAKLPYHARLLPRETWEINSGKKRSDELPRVAARLGLTRFSHTGDWSPCYESLDAAVYCYQPPPYHVPSFTIAAESERHSNYLAEILCEGLGLIRTRL